MIENLITVRSIMKNKECEPEFTPMPNGFIDNGWGAFLPTYYTKMIFSLSLLISEGKNKEGVISDLSNYFNDEDFILLNVRLDPINMDEESRDSFEREMIIKLNLEKSGFYYPLTIEKAVILLIEFGILFNLDVDGEVFLDLRISPFSKPSSYINTEGYMHRIK